MSQGSIAPGWYHAEGDPPGTTRWWDGTAWVGEPQVNQPTGGAVPEPPPAEWPAGGPPVGAAPQPGYVPGLASPGARIGGRIIDLILWILILVVVNLPIVAETLPEILDAAEEDRDPVIEISPVLALATGLASVILVVAYEVVLNLRGGTPGKRAVSARVVKADGSPLDTRSALLRMTPYIAFSAINIVLGLAGVGDGVDALVAVALGLAGLVMVFANKRRQTPWDLVGKTIVVSR